MFNELFWHFNEVIPENKRNYIMRKMDGDEGDRASVMTPEGPLIDSKTRNVKVSSLSQDNELSILTSNLVAIANDRADWKYKIDFQDPFQYLTYDVGGHYVPHVDGNLDQAYVWDDHRKNMSVDRIEDAYKLGKIRKLSIIYALNDNFAGGEFAMYRLKAKLDTEAEKVWEDWRKEQQEQVGYKEERKGEPVANGVVAEELIIPLKAGDCIVFPSTVMHTVKPVTRGKRYSIVSWLGGGRIG
tara:strand:+ start:20 stop:745 length:726 start_codon:yes stop_codon:yes gene_type:complete